MISYDLAKELKEAGWPQPESGNDLNFVYSGGICGRSDARALDAAYAPSLSELIAAMGDKAFTLERNPKHSEERLFTADIGIFGTSGPTAEVAMARLWKAMREWSAFKEYPELLTRDATPDEQDNWWKEGKV